MATWGGVAFFGDRFSFPELMSLISEIHNSFASLVIITGVLEEEIVNLNTNKWGGDSSMLLTGQKNAVC